jgi:hypothetical protein
MTDARGMWHLLEPVHSITYFAAEARTEYESAGLRGFWRCYFAGRATPLGTRSAPVVAGVFQTFAPAFVARAIPAIYDLITPEDALRVRLDGATAGLRRILVGQDAEVGKAAELLSQAIEQLDCGGRPLAAANAALPVPPDPFARLWHTATVLREHRGDGHFDALTAACFDGCEANVLRNGIDLGGEAAPPQRGWTDEQWQAAQARLADRGLLDQDNRVTTAGREAYDAVETATDRAAARPWDRLDAVATANLVSALTPITQACEAAIKADRSQ